MRRVLLLAILATVAVGCGGTQTAAETRAGDALAYLPADAATVLFLSTDVDGEQWQRFDELVFQRMDEDAKRPQTFEEEAERTAKEAGLDWRDDVKPLLGNDIAIGISGDPLSFLGGDGEASVVAALETRGGDVEDVLRKAGFQRTGEASGAALYGSAGEEGRPLVAVEGNVVVVSSDDETLRQALALHDSDGGIKGQQAEEALSDLPSEYFLRGYGTLERLSENEEFRRFAELPLVQALDTWAAAVRFLPGDLDVELAVLLDGERLQQEDLPLVTGDEAPEIVPRETEISGGNRDQSQTTAFLLRALRLGYPNSRFVRAVESVEQELGIDFEQEILRQFNGPSASYVSPDGRTFAARSQVRDPEALRAVLPRIAPHLPLLVEGLQGLQAEGMALLFLFAPDAPATTPMKGVKVDPPATEDGFYRISGLTGAGPSELWFGLVGDLFVVASDEQRAREIADAPTRKAEGARGAGVLRADLRRLGDQVGDFLFFPIKGKELVTSLEASTEELRARVRVKLE